ncbi:MAG: fumarate hydrolyase [Nitrospira sp.]|nr:fumarate hydrolyase [Nitrospira sp.]
MANSKFEIRNSKLKTKQITLPLTKDDVMKLHVGDMVLINGLLVTGRDKVHKFLFHERLKAEQIPFNLKGMILYHCGPIIRKTEKGFKLIAGGPTTSMRVEIYEHQIISEYGLLGVMGKGGMGKKTIDALKKNSCVYLHTIGGAAVYLADRVKRVVDVWKLKEFGMAEAMWLFDVADFPAVVTMDAYGESLHEEIEKRSYSKFKRLIK